MSNHTKDNQKIISYLEDLAYVQKQFLEINLPYRKQKAIEISRKLPNGVVFKIRGDSGLGLPYGKIPRLIILWLITEIKTKKNRRIAIPTSHKFLKELGIGYTGKNTKRVKESLEQINKLSFDADYRDDLVSFGIGYKLISKYHLNWSLVTTSIDNKELFSNKKTEENESYVVVDYDYFELIMNSAFPVRKSTATILADFPMAYEIYFWLTYKAAYNNKEFIIEWSELKQRFAPDTKQNAQAMKDFKKDFKRNFLKVKDHYVINNSYIEKDGLRLVPSNPHVALKPLEVK